LLAQVLTSATSPDQVTKFHTWLGQQTATGSDLQKAAMDAGFEAELRVARAVSTGRDHDGGQRRLDERARHGIPERPEERHASVQRLRTKAKAAGTLKTNEQQTVTTQKLRQHANHRHPAGESAGRLRADVRSAGGVCAAASIELG
jgi:hypothetical protein